MQVHTAHARVFVLCREGACSAVQCVRGEAWGLAAVAAEKTEGAAVGTVLGNKTTTGQGVGTTNRALRAGAGARTAREANSGGLKARRRVLRGHQPRQLAMVTSARSSSAMRMACSRVPSSPTFSSSTTYSGVCLSTCGRGARVWGGARQAGGGESSEACDVPSLPWLAALFILLSLGAALAPPPHELLLHPPFPHVPCRGTERRATGTPPARRPRARAPAPGGRGGRGGRERETAAGEGHSSSGAARGERRALPGLCPSPTRLHGPAPAPLLPTSPSAAAPHLWEDAPADVDAARGQAAQRHVARLCAHDRKKHVQSLDCKRAGGAVGRKG